MFSPVSEFTVGILIFSFQNANAVWFSFLDLSRVLFSFFTCEHAVALRVIVDPIASVTRHFKVLPELNAFYSLVPYEFPSEQIASAPRSEHAFAVCIAIFPVALVLSLILSVLIPNLHALAMPLSLLIYSSIVYCLPIFFAIFEYILHLFFWIFRNWENCLSFSTVAGEPVFFNIVFVIRNRLLTVFRLIKI